MLVPGIGPRPSTEKTKEVATALGDDLDAIVLVSPHGERGGVYRSSAGSLDGFGARGYRAEARTDDRAVSALAGAWDRPVMDVAADHGIVVPLLRGSLPDAPVVACALGEITGLGPDRFDAALEDAGALARAIAGAGLGRVAVVVSAHTSAALSQRAPLVERDEARALDTALIDRLGSDVGHIEALAPDLLAVGGACGAAVVVVFARCLAGRAATVLSYSHPFGVGYLEAIATSR